MDASELRRSKRLSVMEGALATAMGTLLSGVFLTGFALSLGASRLDIGVLAALPSLALVAQLAGSFCLERGSRRKRLCVGALAASRVLWIPMLLLLPFVTGTGNHRTLIWGVISLVALSSVISAMGGVAWLSWIRDLIPVRDRIPFLAMRNLFDTALAISLSVAGAAFVDWWALAWPGSSAGYGIVFGLAIACGLFGIALLARIPDAPRAEVPPERFTKLLAAPLQESNFRRLLSFYASWYLSVNLAAPFFAVFMLQNLKIPLWQVTVLQTASSMMGLVGNRFWSRLGQRYGAKPVIFVASLAEAFVPFWWLFMTPETKWGLPIIFASGLFSSPLATGPNNILLSIAPAKNASPYMAVFNAIIGPITALAAVLGGYLAQVLGNGGSTFYSLDGLKVVFLISFVGRLLSLVLLRGIHDPGSASVWCLARHFKTWRFRLLRGRDDREAPVPEPPGPPATQAA